MEISHSSALPQPNQFITQSPTSETIGQQFDLAIALILHQWDALTFAVENGCGGSDSSNKRDGLAGSISDLFLERPNTDEDDIEAILDQYMRDEFQFILDDNSEVEVAAQICALRKYTLRGDFDKVKKLEARYQVKQAKPKANPQYVEEQTDDEDDVSSGEDTSDENDDFEDVVMDEAPTLVSSKQKALPEVDDEGFTKVSNKKRR